MIKCYFSILMCLSACLVYADSNVFCIENPVAAAYMREVDYTAYSDDYSYSLIGNYASTETSYRKDQPDGVVLTWDNASANQSVMISSRQDFPVVEDVIPVEDNASVCTIYNMLPGRKYYYRVMAGENVLKEGAFHTTGQLRMMYLNSLDNVRDMGGWKTEDGHRMRYGRIFRGAEMNTSALAAEGGIVHDISHEDSIYMHDVMKIRLDLDLRDMRDLYLSDTDPANDLNHTILGEDVAYYNEYVSYANSAFTRYGYNQNYRWGRCLKKMIATLREGKNVYYHCTWGADRTGTMAMLIEGLCGVSESDISKDYELTCFSRQRDRTQDYWHDNMAYIKSLSGNTLRDKFETYCLRIGLTKQEIEDLRTEMLEYSVSDRTLVHDSRTDTYLCSVPEQYFDDGFVTSFSCDTARIDFTFLPVVKLCGTFCNDYAQGDVEIFMPENSGNIASRAKIKWRGGTSNADDINKRSYHIKFIDENGDKKDVKLFGLRKDNSWLLNAVTSDLSRVRNRAAMDLWDDFAVKPYYADQEPKVRTATRGQYVELFLNDEYMGIYDMSENIDRSQLKLKKYTTENNSNIIHGQLWKTKHFQYTSMWDCADYDNNSEMWGGFETKYPDIDDVSPTDYSTLYDFVNFVITAPVEEFEARIAEYADMPALRDYFLFTYLLAAVDNYSGKNMLWACYDRETDKKLTIIPWDLDCTVGRYYKPGALGDKEEYYLNPATHDDHYWGMNLFYRLDSCRTGDFHRQVASRYKELRNSNLTLENITHHYVKYMDMLEKSGAYARETALWSGNSDMFGQTLDFAREKDFILEWFRIRLENIDNNGFPTAAIMNVIADETGKDKIYNVQGQRVTDTAKRGVYIINGKKYLSY